MSLSDDLRALAFRIESPAARIDWLDAPTATAAKHTPESADAAPA